MTELPPHDKILSGAICDVIRENLDHFLKIEGMESVLVEFEPLSAIAVKELRKLREQVSKNFLGWNWRRIRNSLNGHDYCGFKNNKSVSPSGVVTCHRCTGRPRK